MEVWKSKTITVDGIELLVHASEDGVTLGKTVDGIYGSDLTLTPDQARTLAYALLEGADRAEGLA